jgi:hypothetical protein
MVVCLSSTTGSSSLLVHTTAAVQSSSPVSDITNAINTCFVGPSSSAVKTNCPMSVSTSPYQATYACHVNKYFTINYIFSSKIDQVKCEDNISKNAYNIYKKDIKIWSRIVCL